MSFFIYFIFVAIFKNVKSSPFCFYLVSGLSLSGWFLCDKYLKEIAKIMINNNLYNTIILVILILDYILSLEFTKYNLKTRDTDTETSQKTF